MNKILNLQEELLANNNLFNLESLKEAGKTYKKTLGKIRKSFIATGLSTLSMIGIMNSNFSTLDKIDVYNHTANNTIYSQDINETPMSFSKMKTSFFVDGFNEPKNSLQQLDEKSISYTAPEFNLNKEKIKVQATELDIMKIKYPTVNFSKIKVPRDVTKQFLGVNNFLALAAEMEGFRGDAHKDPAVGLNIGFGYNITKRSSASSFEVIEDLKSIGLEDKMIKDLIKLSKTPQSKLSKAIKEFNQKHQLDNNQIIDLNQGVALLNRTQYQYEQEARNVFKKSWDKMEQNQQEVLTYAAYKAGGSALSQYKKAINAADYIYKKSKQNTDDFKLVAKHLYFYYKKDGKEFVLDKRATLIAQTFVNEDFLALQVGQSETIKTPIKKLLKQAVDFSHLPAIKVSLLDNFGLEEKKPNIQNNQQINEDKRNDFQPGNPYIVSISKTLSYYKEVTEENKVNKSYKLT